MCCSCCIADTAALYEASAYNTTIVYLNPLKKLASLRRCAIEFFTALWQPTSALLRMAALSGADRRGRTQVGPKRRRLQEDNDILGPVQRQEVQEATLMQRLNEYVERIDTDMVGVGKDCALHAELDAFVLLIAPHQRMLQGCLALSADASHRERVFAYRCLHDH